MSVSKRATFKLSGNSHSHGSDVNVVMTNSGEDAKLYLTFRSLSTAYNEQTGSVNQIRDKLASIIETCLQSQIDNSDKMRDDCKLTTRLEDGYITFTVKPDKIGSPAMYAVAADVMENIGMLTKNGVPLKNALDQVQEAATAQAEGKCAQIEVKLELDYHTAKRAIAKSVELIMPKAQADTFAGDLAEEVIDKYPIRPALPYTAGGNPISNRGTMNDPLYILVNNACSEHAIPDEGKRNYVKGEIFDALENAYDGLGTEIDSSRRRA